MGANAGIPVASQLATERGAVESQQLVAVRYAPLVAPPQAAVPGGLGLDDLPVLFEPGEDFRADVDLQDSEDLRGLFSVGPTCFEDDVDDVLAGISIQELGDGVFDGLVLFQEVGFLENLTAGCAWEDVVS